MKLTAASIACALVAIVLSLPAAEPVPQRTTLESAFGEFWSVKDETFFVFKSSATKRVTLTGTNLKIVCDNLEMTAVGIADKDDKSTLPTLEKFKYLLATGNVHIVQGDREATAGRAEVFPRENRIELTVRPVVTDHGHDKLVNGVVDHQEDYVIRGSKLEMFRGDRRVRGTDLEVEGPSIRDLGFDKSAPPPTRTPPDAAQKSPPAK